MPVLLHIVLLGDEAAVDPPHGECTERRVSGGLGIKPWACTEQKNHHHFFAGRFAKPKQKKDDPDS